MKMTPQQIREKLLEFGKSGKIFHVSFIKRTTGEKREMTARLGVKKGLKGGELGYSSKEKNLLTCWDMQKHGYRSIALENVLEIRGAKKIYKLK